MQDKANFNGYPQNVQMVPQGAHYQPQVNTDQEGSFEQSNPYGNVPPTVVQQGIVYQAVPANQQMAMYPNSGYPAPAYPQGAQYANYPAPAYPQGVQYANYPVSNQMFGTSDQIHLANPYNQVFIIETKIKSGFCCYTCLVYTGLIFTILNILSTLSTPYHPGFQVISIIAAMAMVVGYILAIKAKSTFDTNKQHQVYVIFCVLSAVKFLIAILFAKQAAREAGKYMADANDHSRNGFNNNNSPFDGRQVEESIEGAIIFGAVMTLLLDLLLVYFSHALRKLMKDRDQILINLNSANRIV